MFRLVVLSCLLAASLAQVVDDRDAKILAEQRFNAGDGRAGSAFATENEIVFREESDDSGNRLGEYSYIGSDGQTYTVKYSAGVDGFRILEGSHIPSGGQEAAPFNAEEATAEPLPQIPQRSAAPAPAPAPAPIPTPSLNVEPNNAPVDPDFNPFINPHDPTHRNFQFNVNGAKFAPKVPGTLGSDSVPNCADCQGVNPFINPFDQSHQIQASPGLLAGHLAGHLAGAQRRVPAPAPIPSPVQRAGPAQIIANAIPTGRAPLATTTTPTPRRFFPPGQLSLNRFETGFNFDFQS